MALDCENAFAQEMEILNQINKNSTKLNEFLGIDKEVGLLTRIDETNRLLALLCKGILGTDGKAQGE